MSTHAEQLASYAAVLMERGELRRSEGLSNEAITRTLDKATLNPRFREAAVARPASAAIRAAFKEATPPAVAR